ncbi:hypothetical protein [Citrobacter freundii]|uniref:hypothetical protein n=1 Tax=Citrobacter freundii TaxID=546 RepID=UPI0030CB017C
MSIKRYEMKTKYRGHESWDELEEDEEGSYVNYEDYVALEQKLTDMAVQLANAESKCRELAGVAAENAVLKKAADFATPPDMWIEQADGMLDYRYCEWYVDALKAAMETPATDAFLAEVRAQGVELFAASLKVVGGNEHPYSAVANEFAAQLRKGAAL